MKDFDLTSREKEVLMGLVQGLTNREIAEKLSVTHHTVKAHISAILNKLGHKNRTAAALFALTNDIIRLQD